MWNSRVAELKRSVSPANALNAKGNTNAAIARQIPLMINRPTDRRCDPPFPMNTVDLPQTVTDGMSAATPRQQRIGTQQPFTQPHRANAHLPPDREAPLSARRNMPHLADFYAQSMTFFHYSQKRQACDRPALAGGNRQIAHRPRRAMPPRQPIRSACGHHSPSPFATAVAD